MSYIEEKSILSIFLKNSIIPLFDNCNSVFGLSLNSNMANFQIAIIITTYNLSIIANIIIEDNALIIAKTTVVVKDLESGKYHLNRL